MAYKNPSRKNAKPRAMRFPNHIHWEIHMVRSVEPTGSIRIAMTIAKPRERITLEFLPIPLPENRVGCFADAIEGHLLNETPWYGWPEVVYVEELALLEILESRTRLGDIEFEIRKSKFRSKTSQKGFDSFVKTQPLWMKKTG